MGGGGLNNTATALIIIFLISLLALFAELFYVLWRRRVFCRRHSPTGDFDRHSQQPSDFSSSASPSKELLYFLCLRTRLSRVEPTSNPTLEPPEMELIDIFKLQEAMYGPSRILFTIKEEEKEDLESQKSSAEKQPKSQSKRMCLAECFKIVEEPPAEAALTIGEDHNCLIADQVMTPFSTPCASPLYFTPSTSPTREEAAQER